MDKLLIKSNGEYMGKVFKINKTKVTNDGRTFLEEMKIENPIGKLLVQMSKNQDSSVGDGTTSVVVLCCKLCEKAGELLELGYKPHEIIEGFKEAEKLAQIKINEYIVKIKENTVQEEFYRAVITSLNTKMIKKEKEMLTKICVDSVLMVSDLERKDVNLSNIKMDYIANGSLEDTKLYKGIFLKKSFTNDKIKSKNNCKICLFSHPLEVITKHKKRFQNQKTNIQ
jgi:chaperonin GroEL (HSP60 family)